MHSNSEKLSTENDAFRKRSSDRRNLKTPALGFRVHGKYFANTMTSRQSLDFPARSSQAGSQVVLIRPLVILLKFKGALRISVASDCYLLKFLKHSVEENILSVFYCGEKIFDVKFLSTEQEVCMGESENLDRGHE